MSTRDPFARYRQRLAALGFRPSSARGQNFLLDPSLHRWIAATAAPGPRDLVLEIGVGLGFLTRELAARAGLVLGVEIDSRLVALARDELAGLPNVRLLHADVLGGPHRRLHPEVAAAVAAARAEAAAFLVVANLPYSLSGPLLAELVCWPWLPDRAVLLVQKELADKVAAPAGDPEGGGLSMLVQSVFAARVLRTVPPEVFRPRPKVASAVLFLERLPGPAMAEGERRRFAGFLRALFQQRRKTLRATLPRAAAAAGGRLPQDLDPGLLSRRAEALGVEELRALFARATTGDAGPGP